MSRLSPMDGARYDQSPIDSERSQSHPGVLGRLWRRKGILLLALDAVICILSFIGSYYLRFHVDLSLMSYLPIVKPIPPLAPYLKISALVTALWILLLYKDRAYDGDLQFSTGMAYQIQRVLICGFYSMIFLMVVSFMYRYLLLSRVVYMLGFVSACTLMIFLRICFRIMDTRLSNQCVFVHKVLLMGWNPSAEAILGRLQAHNKCTQVAGRLLWRSEMGKVVQPETDIPVIGMVDDLEKVHKQTGFDQLIIVASASAQRIENNGSMDRQALIEALNFCEALGISCYMVHDVLEITVERQELGTFSGVPIIRLRDSALHPVYAWVKRGMDVSVSLAILVLGLPLWVVIALMIRLSGPGPIIYLQKRAGLHGRPFTMLKFRSMVQDADEKLKDILDFDQLDEPVFKIPRDPRVTGIGRILRRTSLDEIPQLLNVLAGSMSLVGPRPEQLELVEKYTPYQRRRLKAKPGITGYQQVVSRADPSLAKRIEYDLHYLKYQSLFLDLYILFKTLIVVARGNGTE